MPWEDLNTEGGGLTYLIYREVPLQRGHFFNKKSPNMGPIEISSYLPTFKFQGQMRENVKRGTFLHFLYFTTYRFLKKEGHMVKSLFDFKMRDFSLKEGQLASLYPETWVHFFFKILKKWASKLLV